MKSSITSAFSSTPRLQSFLTRLFFIVTLVILWVFILPGAVAWHSGLFYDYQIAAKLRGPAANAYQKYIQERNDLDQFEAQLLKDTKTLKSPEEARALTEALKNVPLIRQSLRSPIFPTAFFSDEAAFVFFLHFLFLGTLYLLAADDRPNLSIRVTLVLGFAIYLAFTWPNWFRNFLMTEYFPDSPTPGRTVFAWVHWDIDHLGFLLQEARVLSMFLFDAVLWQVWVLHALRINEVIKNWSDSPPRLDAFADRALILSREFNRWQYQSLLLIGAFLPWTWFFWRKVYEQDDIRYIITAIVLHVVWAVSWFCLSLPVLWLWKQWSEYKQKALNSVFGRPYEDPDAERVLDLFKDAAPVSTLNVFGAGATVVASMLLPFVHVFFKSSG
jgi:hypothetical protein